VALTEKQARKKQRRTGTKSSRLPRGLARAQANVRGTELALDETVQEYLNLIDAQGASPHQLAAFGSFLAQSGMVRDAMEYYTVALNLASDDPVLWVNAGTLQLQTKNYSAAVSSFSRALSINPNNAVAHYNLGAALDEMDRYEDAIAAYKTALSLDPSLGDPAQNPQAANNDLLLAVKLMLYQEQAGSLSHPLIDVSTGGVKSSAMDGNTDR
jgi:tetratricopeptide (TPR) repeat protein